jgi:hypothetical protein
MRPNEAKSRMMGAFSIHAVRISFPCNCFMKILLKLYKLVLKIIRMQEPHLLIFAYLENPSPHDRDKGLIIAENSVVLQMDKFNIIKGLITVVIGCYCIFHFSYPKSSASRGFLSFVQEILLEMPKINITKKGSDLSRNGVERGMEQGTEWNAINNNELFIQ